MKVEVEQSLFIRSKYRLASYQVYLSRDPLIVSGEIWAEQSCHIPDHCKSPTNISQLHQSHHCTTDCSDLYAVNSLPAC